MQKVGLKAWVAKLLAPALSVALVLVLVLAASPYAVAQSAFNPDPAQKWVGWQGGSAAVTTPQLRDGNVYKLNPAEIIYYAALENRVNPLLLLVKLQEEQSLIGQTYAGAALQHKLDRAVGYGVLESNPSTTKWFGFYPQLVGMSYEFSVMGKKKDFHAAFLEYTPHEDKYAALQTRYAQYAQVLNRAAGKNYAAMPTSAGYMGDFRDVLPQHIQAFLDNYPTNLKDRNLFTGSGGGGNPGVGVGVGVGNGAKIINQPAIPTQMQKDQPLRFTVQTDKPAEQVKITFQNPVGEALLTGSGTQWSLDRVVTAAGVRPWVISVITAGKVTDDHLRGSLTVMGLDMPPPAPQLPVTPVQPVQPVQPIPVLPTITVMNNAVSTAQLRVRQKAEFTLSGVNLASTVLVSFTNCDEPVTKFLNAQTMTHECVPRTQGEQRLFWKTNAADVEHNIKSFAIAPEILPPQPKGDSLDTFVNRWLSNPVDFDRSYGFQCVDLMHRYAVDVLDLNSSLPRGNAYDVFANTSSANFTKVINSPSAVPKRGDIIFWNKLPNNGNAGHVAIFIEGDSNQFTSFDQNYCSDTGSGKGNCAPRKVPHNYAGIVGWLSPKSTAPPSTSSPPPAVSAPAPPLVTDGMGFVGETVPDKTVINAGTQFTKSWTLRNTGTSTWDSNYCLRPVSGDVLGQSAICVNGAIAPGASHSFVAAMLAPAGKAADTEYIQVWALSKVGQAKIGTQVTVQIKVAGQARPVPAPVPAPAPVAPAPQPSRPPVALPVVPVAPAPQPSRPPVALPVAPVVKPMQITSLSVPQNAAHLHALSVAVFANQVIGSATFEFTDGRGANMVAKNSSYAMQCIGSSCTVTTAKFNATYVSGARPWRVTVNNGSGSDSKTGSVNVTQ